MPRLGIVSLLLLCVAFQTLAQETIVAEVIISEIMYNPQGSDSQDGASSYNKEWVEIYNTGTQPVDLSGWTLEDIQDGSVSSQFPNGVTLQPSEALVITGDATSFDAHWGTGISRIEVNNFPSLANSPSPSNETVAIRSGGGTLFDFVNYDDEATWPLDTGSDGASIFVRPEALGSVANNNGTNWLPSMAGVYGATFASGGNLGENHGSPGFVETIPQASFEPSDDAAWSLVVFPDTQNYAKSSAHHPVLNEMTQWVADHRDEWGVLGLLHVGDIVNNNNTSSPSSGDQTGDQQWQNVRNAFNVLDGQVPYVLATGNHDHGSTNAQARDTQLNDYFQASDNSLNDPLQGGILKGYMEPGRLENAYYEIVAPDGRELLVVSLEWGPRQEAVDWAERIASLSKYEDHTTILVTHAYMFHDETRYDWDRNLDADPNNDQGGNPYSYPTGNDTNDGEDLWEELVKLHGNFEFVFSGHVGGDGLGYLASLGDEGNLVHQMLFNSQFESSGGNGWLRVLEFLEDGETVRVRTYSPHFGLERTDSANLFELSISSSALVPGDMDGNGQLGVEDIQPFIQALTDKAAYLSAHPGLDPNALGDLDGNEKLDFGDLALFRALLNALPAESEVAVPEPSGAALLLLLSMASLIPTRVSRRS